MWPQKTKKQYTNKHAYPSTASRSYTASGIATLHGAGETPLPQSLLFLNYPFGLSTDHEQQAGRQAGRLSGRMNSKQIPNSLDQLIDGQF
mmetsp:Transcript_9158/g.17946  ORF Transcript_9158/g.17946 Transcript_9158/m.17946 type:complete len:90 (-) Transcript_9158:1771-2040(-)